MMMKFVNDKETRISVYGYILFFCGVPIAWKSKSMKSVVLSTTEAEYVTVSEVVKEIKFLYLKIKVNNMGAIWFANNSGVSKRTKHIDIRAHFVQSFVIDKIMTIDFVKSVENTSDLMTKNQQSVHFKSAQPKLVYMVHDMEEEKTEKQVQFETHKQGRC